MAELLVWPIVIAYGEAALVYAGEVRGHRRYDSLGIWGVRVGWLASSTIFNDPRSSRLPWERSRAPAGNRPFARAATAPRE